MSPAETVTLENLSDRQEDRGEHAHREGDEASSGLPRGADEPVGQLDTLRLRDKPNDGGFP